MCCEDSPSTLKASVSRPFLGSTIFCRLFSGTTANSVQPVMPLATDPTANFFDFDAFTTPIAIPRITSPIWTGGT